MNAVHAASSSALRVCVLLATVGPLAPGCTPAHADTGQTGARAIRRPRGPRIAPPSLECTQDRDCELFDEEIADSLPRTRECCPGCTVRAGNRESLSRFRSECRAAPPPQCPPIGCAQPIMHAACVDARCIVRVGRSP